MSNAYSNKALPSGTILREWRLEEVLGVGGFGIVYKGRGIYFDELVAIKEYFPSSISERSEDATVVPVDSNAEEVHALGLKKFVEEAKLLWNLSTPTRHPNIVSVRSLFEIHGTAYMVMDFEDGTSLSKMLKKGIRFNESSLANMIIPIARGLERAHRVGVLHRDIKPPNIIVNDDGRAVLIDFGSARFESGEATSTKVTFHTPPYAPIEQYVKTFEQGPWTDIYALGVVVYECITGEKPLEVLERMHGDAGTPLAEGNWPGYSQNFLTAIDAAMKIRPEERPQSISEWLDMFDAEVPETAPADDDTDEDDEATRVVAYDTSSETIEPVAPPPAGFSGKEPTSSPVPADPKDVEFKGAGQETGAAKKAASHEDLPKPAEKPVEAKQADEKKPEEKKPEEKKPAEKAPEPPAAKVTASGAAVGETLDRSTKPKPGATTPGKDTGKDAGKDKPATPASGQKSKAPLLAGGAAVALLLAIGGGYALFSGGSSGGAPDPALLQDDIDVVQIVGAGGLAPALKTLADEAREAKAPEELLTTLDTEIEQLEGQYRELQAMSEAEEVNTLSESMGAKTVEAAKTFAAALAKEAQDGIPAFVRRYPWANPANEDAAADEPANRQQAASRFRNVAAAMEIASQAAKEATDPEDAITAARRVVAQFGALATAQTAVARARGAQAEAEDTPDTPATAAPAAVATPAPAPAAATTSNLSGPVTSSQRSRLNQIVDRANSIARDVIQMERRNRPGSNASDEEKAMAAVRQGDAQTAQEYQSYLANLQDSMRGVETAAEAENMIGQANQTLNYIQLLQRRSSSTLN